MTNPAKIMHAHTKGANSLDEYSNMRRKPSRTLLSLFFRINMPIIEIEYPITATMNICSMPLTLISGIRRISTAITINICIHNLLNSAVMVIIMSLFILYLFHHLTSTFSRRGTGLRLKTTSGYSRSAGKFCSVVFDL